MDDLPQTLLEAVRYFSDLAVCNAYMRRIRAAMQAEDLDKFDGPAEADTTYVGGRAENMHAKRREKLIRGRGAVGKTIVHGVLQRSTDDQPSQVRATVIGSDDAARLLPQGWRAFDALARGLAQIPKAKVEAQIAANKAAKKKRKK